MYEIQFDSTDFFFIPRNFRKALEKKINIKYFFFISWDLKGNTGFLHYNKGLF